MESVVVQRFKIKCTNCNYRGTADTKEAAIREAEGHLSYDWRSNTHEHTLKIAEVLFVSKKEEEDD